MNLQQIQKTLENVRITSKELDWQMALAKAECQYKTKYIDGLSRNYRLCCDWYHEIGDSFLGYLKRKPWVEIQLKEWYFKNLTK